MAENENGKVVDDIDVEAAPAREAEGSFISGWPAMLLSVGMVCAALYSFSPRPPAEFEPTKIESDQLQINGVARQDSRYIAAGELGIIMVADSPSGPWKEAKVEPQRGSNLTDVKFVDKNVAIAVGHSGWILRSEDGGATWKELAFQADSADPLLGVSGPFDGTLYAYGAFGQFLKSTDGGKSFVSERLSVVEPEPEPAEVPAEAEDVAAAEAAGESEEPSQAAEGPSDDPFGDPFADFAAGVGGMDDPAGLHIYDIAQLGDGSLMLVGERGAVMRSTDGGATWVEGESIYSGSFYGVMPIGNKGALIYGMRGNAFYTSDLGDSWDQSDIPLVQGLFGGARSDAGTIVLVGASNTVLVSTDSGKSFVKASSRGPHGVVGIVPLDSGSWLTGGEGGLAVKNVLNYLSAAATGVWS